MSPGGRTDAEATSAAIQAILALGEHPDDAFWKVGVNTPTYALGVLQQTNGSYRLTSRERLRPLAVTSWALTAMRRKSFASFPKNIGSAETAFKFRPVFRTVSPKNGAKFKSHVVLIRATYTDFYPKGTGIRPSACRLYVNNENKSRPADIDKYGLRLLLKNVPNGAHTYKIELRDQAGNVKVRRAQVHRRGPESVSHVYARPAAHLQPRPCLPDGASHERLDAQAVHHDRRRRRRRTRR